MTLNITENDVHNEAVFQNIIESYAKLFIVCFFAPYYFKYNNGSQSPNTHTA